MLDCKDTSALFAEADHALHLLILSLREMRSQLTLMRIQHLYTMTTIAFEMREVASIAHELSVYPSYTPTTSWKEVRRQYHAPYWPVSST